MATLPAMRSVASLGAADVCGILATSPGGAGAGLALGGAGETEAAALECGSSAPKNFFSFFLSFLPCVQSLGKGEDPKGNGIKRRVSQDRDGLEIQAFLMKSLLPRHTRRLVPLCISSLRWLSKLLMWDCWFPVWFLAKSNIIFTR